MICLLLTLNTKALLRRNQFMQQKRRFSHSFEWNLSVLTVVVWAVTARQLKAAQLFSAAGCVTLWQSFTLRGRLPAIERHQWTGGEIADTTWHLTVGPVMLIKWHRTALRHFGGPPDFVYIQLKNGVSFINFECYQLKDPCHKTAVLVKPGHILWKKCPLVFTLMSYNCSVCLQPFI